MATSSNDRISVASSFTVEEDENPGNFSSLTSTEPYPGPGVIESATVYMKNWVRQGYLDFLSACNDDGGGGVAVKASSPDSKATTGDASAEYDAIPPTEEICTVLGRRYSALNHRASLMKDLETRLWFTYRRGFPPIGGTGPTTDTGWGCMLRCGQMMLAQTLMDRHLGRDWRWDPKGVKRGGSYEGILKLFQDKKDALYSIHQIAQMGQSEGKPVGSWFGPNTVAQVIRKLSIYDDWSSICVYVAMDNTVVIEDIETLCTRSIPHPATDDSLEKDVDSPPPSLSSIILGKDLVTSADLHSFFPTSQRQWHPLLLVVPLRLGLSEINPMYQEPLKTCLSMRQSVGMIGGTPNHAHYFVGHVGDSLFYFDPHTTQPFVDLDEVALFYDTDDSPDIVASDTVLDRPFEPPRLRGDDTYHRPLPERMRMMDLDPSVAVGFFCKDEADFRHLCSAIENDIAGASARPLFEISRTHPPHWPPFEPYPSASPSSMRGAAASIAEFMLVESERHYDTDDEFELL